MNIGRAVFAVSLLAVSTLGTPRGFSAGRDLEVIRSFEWVNGLSLNSLETRHLNRDNDILGLSDGNATSEMRPNLKMIHEDDLFLIARPRFRLTVDHVHRKELDDTTSGDGEAIWNELFGLWRVSGALIVAYGIHNFQWGPGELISPSNRMFHENVFDKNAFYEPEGKNLVRANFSIGRQFSAIFLGEVRENGESKEAPFGYQEAFDKKALLKLEYARSQGASHIGVVGGGGEVTKPWTGIYGLYELNDDWAIYTDTCFQRGSRAYYPEEPLPGVTTFSQRWVESKRFFTLALSGIRYNLESGGDIKFEHLFNESGYTNEEYDIGVRAVDISTPTPEPAGAQGLALFLNPGLEFIKRNYLFLAGRFPDLGSDKKFTFYLRYLFCTEDASQRALAQLDWDYSNHGSYFASLIINTGADHAEFARLTKGTLLTGYKYNW